MERFPHWASGYCGAQPTPLGSGDPSSAFGPHYWLARCDGFQVVATNGTRGCVDEIVEVDGVAAGLCVRFGDDDVQVEPAGILNIDPVGRVVVVDRSKTR
jgi:hypothetical protein